MDNRVELRNKKYNQFDLLETLTIELGLDIGDLVREILVAKSDYIYCPPANNDRVYEIMDGAVKLGSYTESGEEFIYDILHDKDFFGNFKYLNNQFFEFSKALVECRIREYDLSFFKQVIIEEPVITEWFISYLIKRWCTTEKKLRKINEKSHAEKLLFLKTSFDIEILDAEGLQHNLFELLTQKDLGDLIGATRQTVANYFKKEGRPLFSGS
jgi:CRP-like cAMP-binding protein